MIEQIGIGCGGFAAGVLFGMALGYHAGIKAGMRSLAGMIQTGVLGYGPDYPRGNRLQAQANNAMTKRRQKAFRP